MAYVKFNSEHFIPNNLSINIYWNIHTSLNCNMIYDTYMMQDAFKGLIL